MKKSRINGCFRVCAVNKKLARVFALAALTALTFAACDLFQEVVEETKYNGVFFKNASTAVCNFTVCKPAAKDPPVIVEREVKPGEIWNFDKLESESNQYLVQVWQSGDKACSKTLTIEKKAVPKKISWVWYSGTDFRQE